MNHSALGGSVSPDPSMTPVVYCSNGTNVEFTRKSRKKPSTEITGIRLNNCLWKVKLTNKIVLQNDTNGGIQKKSVLSEGKGFNCIGRKYKSYLENMTSLKLYLYLLYTFQMEQLDEASKQDIPYPYEMSKRGNAARVNRYLPKPSIANLE